MKPNSERTARRMKILTRTLLAGVGVLVLGLVVALFLPATWKVERAIVIHAPPAAVFPYLNTLKKWSEWTVWYDAGTERQVSFEGPDAGVGAIMRWSDRKSRGELKIVESRPREFLAYDLAFNEGEFTMRGELALAPVAEGTRVTWSSHGDVAGKLLGRYFILPLDRLMGGDFERNLARLKQRIETSGARERSKPRAQ